MIVAFVGFAGGYTKLVLGPDAPILAGAIAASLVTWFTFLPSFLFIFAGGPFIESTHENLDLTAPLTAITAAVVGVILNLAIFFGQHVLWPQGFGGGVDVVAAAIALGAATALFGFKRSVIQVIVGCAVAGLAIKALTSGGLGL
jgi:chromate transporter